MRHLFAICFCGVAGTAAADQSAFPYPVVEVAGEAALERWFELRQGPGTPVILGGLSDYEGFVDSFSPEWAEFYPDTPQDILERAAQTPYPDALQDLRRAEWAQTLEWLRDNYEEGSEELTAWEAFDPVTVPEELQGRVPLFHVPAQMPLSYIDYATNAPYASVFIAVLPTENPWEAPAYLRWGGWNANPPPEVHVAALKDWYDRYGAVPLALTSDVMELYAPNRPTDIDDAQALAAEHFLLCEDLIYQGYQHLGYLAADRMRTPYWFFWWD